jgi:ABC-type glycerol-3-phosphate transport system substrate-binding protein
VSTGFGSRRGSAPRPSRRTAAAGLAVAACLLLLLAAGLAGCQLLPESLTPVPPTVEPEILASPEPTETLPPGITPLRFWEPFALDRPQGLLLGEMIRDFEAENPDVTVNIVAKSGYTGLHSAILAQLPDGELPDLALAFPSMVAEYALTGAVLPLDAFFADPETGLAAEDLDDIPAAFLQAGRVPGYGSQVLAFPFAYNAVGMWVNGSLLAEAGWDHPPGTWQEFELACWDVVTTTGSGCYPFVESASTFTAWLYSRGGQLLDPMGQRALFSGPAGVESLALLRRLIEAGLAWRPEEPYGDYVAFANGQAAFTFSSTGNQLLYQEAYQAALQKGVPPFRWYQTLVPQADPGQPATVIYGSSLLILRSEPDREFAAWRLIRWLTATDQAARWAAQLESLPVRTSALSVMTDTLQAYPLVGRQVREILPYGRPEPSIAAGLEVRDLLYTAILSVTQELADPQSALDQAARDANAILSRP